MEQLDVQALQERGWTPNPFDEFVVKLHSRCNLACDYCYVYEMADQSWMGQPKVMQRSTMRATCARIGEHSRRFRLPAVSVVLHGGEPLLAGQREIEFFLSELTRAMPSKTELVLGIQTNGVLLDENYLQTFDRWGVKVGVSLDGGQTANDRHRKFRDGRGSYTQVAEGIARLTQKPYRHLFSGLLCTIDVNNDPVATYEELIRFDPPAIDFLLPHGNWTQPPPQLKPGRNLTPYGDWLCMIFDRWIGGDRREVGVRFFDQIIDLLLGTEVNSEAIGLAPVRLAVVETDGSLEQVDSLKSAFDGAADLGLKGPEHSLEEALWHPAVVARQIGVEALSPTCRQCPIRQVCGGGHFTHRYREGSGFLNPSAYCLDLKRIIGHIAQRLRDDITRLTQREKR
ncbi:FxsB family radical SAM/SPASM domain protein [Streptomyces sp. B21-108]|uniref:FxsB family cyclophane-forming radical SAM/SPASM peptide maturase n=1 Tax=Streptomyces sp. B21-108 TaxID=3039419 RepID=UPI002FF2CF25